MSGGLHPATLGERLGVVAGGGSLPRALAEAARARGFQVVVLRFGEGRAEDWSDYEGADYAWGRTGDAISDLRRQGVGRLVWGGTLSVRPDFRSLIPSVRTLLRLPQALAIVRGGDDRLLTNAARYLQRQGIEVMAVQDLLPEILAPAGAFGARAPIADESRALCRAAEAAGRLGALDIGQAVVASAERVIALEGIEGTREMLRRVADLRGAGRLGRRESLALVKRVKPGQDRRFDLPSIGAKTIEEAAAAGIAAIGISAGAGLVLDLDDTLAAAARAGIALTGLAEAGEGEGP